MARAPLRTRKRRRLAALVALGILGMPAAGYAAMAVVDASAIAKLTDQLNRMQQQIEYLRSQTEWLTKMSGQMQDTVDAIGAIGRISLPSLNLDRLTGQVMRDIQCLTPDLSKMMPNLSLDDIRFSSICGGRSVYQQALWLDPETVRWNDGDGWSSGPQSNAARWEAQASARKEIEARREALVKDIASTGLAMADMAATENAENNAKAADELEEAVNSAQTQQARLAAIGKGQVLASRQLNQQNQLLAQLVKIQSAMLMQMSTPIHDRPGGE
ncbi:hypothetical protein [Telmatospirillum sp. J64-1]|uniref:hypothetical protein n=1 Tax=Telmatospirillum sp. J64-1 TaxID=2502183 RepID=UPI00115C6BEA|nr:hypothetical protein [Telmatospirillum sp. J64-1]